MHCRLPSAAFPCQRCMARLNLPSPAGPPLAFRACMLRHLYRLSRMHWLCRAARELRLGSVRPALANTNTPLRGELMVCRLSSCICPSDRPRPEAAAGMAGEIPLQRHYREPWQVPVPRGEGFAHMETVSSVARPTICTASQPHLPTRFVVAYLNSGAKHGKPLDDFSMLSVPHYWTRVSAENQTSIP